MELDCETNFLWWTLALSTKYKLVKFRLSSVNWECGRAAGQIGKRKQQFLQLGTAGVDEFEDDGSVQQSSCRGEVTGR